MIVHPDFLQSTLGHFYKQQDVEQLPALTAAVAATSHSPEAGLSHQSPGATSGFNSSSPFHNLVDAVPTSPQVTCRRWVLKDKAAFLQTPQDFGMLMLLIR
eukprot:GHRR01008036.1.p3 GENE.GHRR01008036.1~~GHRR01008036.1.p3  ORF type:complete len:101 (+),score=33.93 GHRR01008036.1:1269-1571(+)